MTLGLSGKTAFVTGAAQGIGFGIATQLARVGCTIVIADLNRDRAQIAADALRQDSFQALGLEVDITDDASVEAGVSASINQFGHVDILVNNAGIHVEKVGETSTIDQFRACHEVNLYGAWRTAQAFIPHFRMLGGGRIVNIASTNGQLPWVDTPGYSASKAGMINLTRSMALELGVDNINVNSVCPGSVLTPMADPFFEDKENFLERMVARRAIKRELSPLDIGGAVVFFASELSSMVSGQSLNVCGGYVLN